ncbi:MAG: flavin monoamine oxidase family protein [Bosea sp. (in: a-proteobacteria)]
MASAKTPAAGILPVIIVGAGTAGIAAARRLKAAGLQPLILEARDRIGGRAVTVDFGGKPVDLGAHWLHAARSNPLVKLARNEGLGVSRAVYRFRALKDGKGLGMIAGYGLDHAWERAEARIFEAADLAERRGHDLSVTEAVGNVGPWTRACLFMHANYDCGMEPEHISTVDFAGVEDDRDMLVAGGLGALIARLAAGLDITTGVEIIRIAQEPDGCTITARDGRVWQARQLILTVPMMVLASGSIAFEPAPEALLSAAATFRAAAYEHAVLRAASAPWSNRHDEIVFSMAGKEPSTDHAALFAHMEGADLHYLDLLASEGHRLAAMPEAQRITHVREKLQRHFGATPGVDILHVTAWAADPFAQGAWAMAGIGKSSARTVLRQIHGAITYAGEAASQDQWGTVGGAWLEGTRAAEQMLGQLTGV